MRRRTTVLFAFAAIAAALIVPAVAFACGGRPQTYIVDQPSSGPAGSTTNVNGYGFNGGGPVNIFWNDTSGQPIGQSAVTAEGYFGTSVAVPDVPPDTYQLIAVQDSAPGVTATKASAPFTVESKTAERNRPPVPPQPATATNQNTSGNFGSQSGGGGNAATGAPSSSGGYANVSIPGDPSGQGASAGAAVGSGAVDYGSPEGNGLSGGRPTVIYGGVGAPQHEQPGQSVTVPGSVATGAPPQASSGLASPRSGVALRDVRHEVWGSDRGISLTGSGSSGSSPSGPLSGGALLSIGVVGLLAGFALVQVRRRLTVDADY